MLPIFWARAREFCPGPDFFLDKTRFSVQPQHTFGGTSLLAAATACHRFFWPVPDFCAPGPILCWTKRASNCSHSRLFEPKTRTPASHCSQSTLLRQRCRRDQRWCRRPLVTLVKPMLFHTFLHQWASHCSLRMVFEWPRRLVPLKPMEFHHFLSSLNVYPT